MRKIFPGVISRLVVAMLLIAGFPNQLQAGLEEEKVQRPTSIRKEDEKVVSVTSPDSRIKVSVWLDAGRPFWKISHEGENILEAGMLGIELAGDTFHDPFILERTERGENNTTWQAVWGNLSKIRDHYHELVLTLREAPENGRRFQIALRVYNEGVGCRYMVPAQKDLERVTIKKRRTEYRFGGNRTVYQNRKYEYGTVGIDNMSRSEGNVTIAAGGGRFVSLTDADCADFSRVAWERKKDAPGTIIGNLYSPAEGKTPFHTSWEVMIVGSTAGKLYENRHIVENLNPPCALADTSWIRPGESISQIRNTRMVTGELKKLMDFASAHNIDYVEIDHSWCGAETKWTPAEIEFFEKNKSKFWDDKPEWKNNVGGNLLAPAKGWVPFRPKANSGGNYVDLDVAEVAAYGHRLNPKVGLSVYVRGAVLQEFGGEHPADKVFALYEQWGLEGIKLGFVPSASQQNERAVTDVVRKAALHKLTVTIHDAYYPSGLTRTYPNLVNVEGVAGEEAEHSIPGKLKGLHDVMLPFTRGLMGPIDYTPEMFKTCKTNAHQVAMLGVFHGRPSIRGGMKQWAPGGSGGGEIEFLEKLPGLFDEMKVVTDLGKYVTVARRRADRWFVASMSDSDPRTYSLPLDFLAKGVTFNASIYADIPGKLQTTHLIQKVFSTSAVRIDMEPNGGHLMILEPGN